MCVERRRVCVCIGAGVSRRVGGVTWPNDGFLEHALCVCVCVCACGLVV